MVLIGVVVTITLATIYRENIIMIYLVNSSISAKELPQKWVKPAFKFVTKRELPTKAYEIHGLFQGGRDPAIFVKFTASSKDIENFLRLFLKSNEKKTDPVFYLQGELWIPRYTEEIITSEFMHEANSQGYNLFYIPSQWQEGRMSFWNQKTIRSGRLIEYMSHGGYKILVDDIRNTVYIFSYNM